VGLDAHKKPLKGVKNQTMAALNNVEKILKKYNAVMDDVVKVVVYVTDIANYETVNECYMMHFSAPYPARTFVAVSRAHRLHPLHPSPGQGTTAGLRDRDRRNSSESARLRL
jgi:2-iminobutanoate/2-iminopropanoate deaminase